MEATPQLLPPGLPCQGCTGSPACAPFLAAALSTAQAVPPPSLPLRLSPASQPRYVPGPKEGSHPGAVQQLLHAQRGAGGPWEGKEGAWECGPLPLAPQRRGGALRGSARASPGPASRPPPLAAVLLPGTASRRGATSRRRPNTAPSTRGSTAGSATGNSDARHEGGQGEAFHEL